jgi:hypothetical protein
LASDSLFCRAERRFTPEIVSPSAEDSESLRNVFFNERRCIMKRIRSHHALLIGLAGLVLCLVSAPPAAAQFGTGFEPPDYDGSAAGVGLAGQNGWYIPVVVGSSSVDFSVFTYEDNALLLSENPLGETQFIGMDGAGGGTFPRAQLDFDWSQSDVWTVSYDLCGRWNGLGAAQNNLGSFSLQDSNTSRSFIQLNVWVPGSSDHWRALYNVFDAAGMGTDFQLAGPAWDNLEANHWFNQSVTFDFAQNRILSVSITDLDTGDTTTASPDRWYLQGGATPTQAVPTGLRFFVGGDVMGNIMGFDNLSISPGGPASPGRLTKSISVPANPSAVIE